MGAKVKLNAIIDGIEMQTEEFESYLNKEKGEVVFVSSKALLAAEDGEDFDRLVDWEQEEEDIANDIVEHDDKYANLPSEDDIDEYDMIERFCYSLEDDAIQSALLNAIRGRGAFRRFKDKIITLGVRDEWFAFRDNCYKQIAIDFCEEEQIDYVE
ncbi:hypothetical protein JCM21714_3 [Gracilibacillus boraciitolerans JCM 21714]|uniref:Uncharacterized protein n=1 Tax=Gracilibacillus boraciitolerans JCM 21714 TaxID=1298598 RepID=W4VE31_9BACI|nr:UPF0158 family protein [Gracilibacillus boraciitolerans]GAE91068.1 hypothetical protein JCM21714_3 [Gracilibacillus boraciitolerans JCM 21714]